MTKPVQPSVSKDAQKQVKQRTDDLIDDDDFNVDSDFSDESYSDLSAEQAGKGKFSSVHRKRLENYLEDRRLKREIADDYDF